MTRAEARRLSGREADENGPDPAEDPILYLEDREEPEKKEK